MRFFAAVGSIAMLVFLSGCGASELEGSSAKPSDAGVAKLASHQEGPSPGQVDASRAQRRFVIRNATLSVRVPSVEEAEQRVTRTLASWGGYVEKSLSRNLASNRPMVDLVARVPVERFEEALKMFGALGTVLDRSVTGEDVTSKVVDLDARLATMKATEASVRQLLSRANSLDEITSLREKLGQMRADIESLAAQRKSLGERSALSTIRIAFEQRSSFVSTSGDPNWAQEAWASSTQSLMLVARGVGSMGIAAVVHLPIWGPLAYFAWLLAKLWRRKQNPAPVVEQPGAMFRID